MHSFQDDKLNIPFTFNLCKEIRLKEQKMIALIKNLLLDICFLFLFADYWHLLTHLPLCLVFSETRVSKSLECSLRNRMERNWAKSFVNNSLAYSEWAFANAKQWTVTAEGMNHGGETNPRQAVLLMMAWETQDRRCCWWYAAGMELSSLWYPGKVTPDPWLSHVWRGERSGGAANYGETQIHFVVVCVNTIIMHTTQKNDVA